MTIYNKVRSVINVLIKKRNETILLYTTFSNGLCLLLTEY